MKNYVVDYESYWNKAEGISASLLGNEQYYAQSYAYCVSVVADDFKWVGTIDEAKQKFPVSFWADPEKQFWAANSNFDQGWTEHVFGKEAVPRPWKCILDRGAFSQLPMNVADVAKVVLGRPVDKTLREWMEGKHFRDLSAEDQRKILDYCLHDGEEEYALLKQTAEPTAFEDALAEHTRAINRRGIHIDEDRMCADRTRLERYSFEAFKKIPWRNDRKPLSSQALVDHCNKIGVPAPRCLDKRDDEANEIIDAHPALAEVVAAMRAHRYGNKGCLKIDAIKRRLVYDDHGNARLPLEMMYCGARHTRRWSSRGVNIQNLDREPFWIDEQAKARYEAACKSDKSTDLEDYRDGWVWSRSWLVPPPGKRFLILDYSQIEPRCLHYLVGNTKLIDAVRSGFSVYEAYARVAKNWKGEKGTLKKQLGVAAYTKIKNEVLGLGYGMGAAKYESYGKVPFKEAKLTVDNFRRANPKVVGQWTYYDEVIKLAAADKEDLRISLLNGEHLTHFGVREGKYGYESFTIKGDFGHASMQGSLWGGTLTENCLAGDTEVLTDLGWVRIEDITTSHLVHDGEKFVRHGGLLRKGLQNTIDVAGVRVTPDHLLMSEDGWVPASESRFVLYEVHHEREREETVRSSRGQDRDVDCYAPGREQRQAHRVGGSVRVRECCSGDREGDGHEDVLLKEVSYPPEHDSRGGKNARPDGSPYVRCVAFDATEVRGQEPSCLQELRRTRNQGVLSVEAVQGLLGGHVRDMGSRTGFGQDRQQLRVLSYQLPMDGQEDEREEQTQEKPTGLGSGRRRRTWDTEIDSVFQDKTSRTAVRGGVEAVFDIADCGPRHRFVVRAPAACGLGSDRALIVHNCIQRFARDVIGEAILRLERAGFVVCFTAHDEVILAVDEHDDSALPEAVQLMVKTPDWCPGLPLAVDGGFADRYTK